jgi:hypothetical protein
MVVGVVGSHSPPIPFCHASLELAATGTTPIPQSDQRNPLCERFPRLYDLSFNKGIKVDRVVRSFGSCLIFRRTLWGDLAKDWFDLLTIIHNVSLGEGDDRVRLKLGHKGFTTKSLYNVWKI